MLSPAFFARPLSIGDLLDWSLRIYRARFGRLLMTAAILLVPLGIVSGVLTGQTLTGTFNLFLSMMNNPETINEEFLADLQRNNDANGLFSLLLLPLSLGANGIVSLALTRQCIGILHNQEVSLGQGLSTGLRRFFPWLGMNLGIMVVFIGLMIVVSIAFFIGGVALAVLAGGIFSATSGSGEPGVAAIFGVYGLALLAFIGPIVYFGARWSVAGVGLVDQRWGAIESLQESWRLTRGHVWRCIILVTLLFLFYGVIYATLMAIAFGATALVLPSSTLASTIIFALVSALLPMLWQPIQSAAFVTLYYDLRMRNQGYDLDLRIQQLETEVGHGRAAQ
jgi:hypothetical protein